MPKVDFKKYRERTHDVKRLRRRVDVQSVFTALGLSYRVKGNEVFALCPNPDHGDKHIGSWSMKDDVGDPVNGLSHCWACGWSGDIYSLIMAVKDMTFHEAVKFSAGHSVDLAIGDEEDFDESDYTDPFIDYEPSTLCELPQTVLVEDGSPCAEYLNGRGFSMRVVNWFGLRDWREERRVFVPLTRKGKIVSWTARTYANKIPKAKTPKGKKGGHRWALFGIDRTLKTIKEVNLCEGWADAIRLYQAGVVNPVALCGSSLTVEKVTELAWAKRIIVWLDGDKAGRLLAKNVVGYMGARCEVEIIELDEERDPADYSVDEIARFKSTPYTKWAANKRQESIDAEKDEW